MQWTFHQALMEVQEEVLGVAIKADYTVTFGFHKVGTVFVSGSRLLWESHCK